MPTWLWWMLSLAVGALMLAGLALWALMSWVGSFGMFGEGLGEKKEGPRGKDATQLQREAEQMIHDLKEKIG